MKTLLIGIAALAACGDNHADAPDAAPPDVAVGEIVPECHEVPFDGTQFMTGADFGPATPGTLAGWDPDGPVVSDRRRGRRHVELSPRAPGQRR